MSSFGKVKSSAKVLAFIGENAYIFFVKTDVNRPIPTSASRFCCMSSKELEKSERPLSAKLSVKWRVQPLLATTRQN